MNLQPTLQETYKLQPTGQDQGYFPTTTQNGYNPFLTTQSQQMDFSKSEQYRLKPSNPQSYAAEPRNPQIYVNQVDTGQEERDILSAVTSTHQATQSNNYSRPSGSLRARNSQASNSSTNGDKSRSYTGRRGSDSLNWRNVAESVSLQTCGQPLFYEQGSRSEDNRNPHQSFLWRGRPPRQNR